MNADEFRKIIAGSYIESMKGCQMPTGVLAELTPAELYAYKLYTAYNELEKDELELRKMIRTIYDTIYDYYEMR